MFTVDDKVSALLGDLRSINSRVDLSKFQSNCEARIQKEIDLGKGLSESSAYVREITDMLSRDNADAEKISQILVHMFALCKWNDTKVVYSFDPSVEDELFQQYLGYPQNTKGNPSDILDRLPHDSFFVSTNIIAENDFILLTDDVSESDYPRLAEAFRGYQRIGFIFSWDYIRGTSNRNFGIYWIYMQHSKKDKIFVVPSYWTLPTNYKNMSSLESIVYHMNDHKDVKSDAALNRLGLALQYLLYLCSINSEVAQSPNNIKTYRPSTNRYNFKYREVKQLTCGEPTGIRIRQFKKLNSAKKSAEGRKCTLKSPHVRRAHYHTFWVGRGENKHKEIRWVAPMYIHKELRSWIQATDVIVKDSDKLDKENV